MEVPVQFTAQYITIQDALADLIEAAEKLGYDLDGLLENARESAVCGVRVIDVD